MQNTKTKDLTDAYVLLAASTILVLVFLGGEEIHVGNLSKKDTSGARRSVRQQPALTSTAFFNQKDTITYHSPGQTKH